jgi:hypothetical protein
VTERSPRAAILQLLRERVAGATICPSEAARLVAGEDWRAAMDPVHAAAAKLATERAVRLTQRGETVMQPTGAYRIGRT